MLFTKGSNSTDVPNHGTLIDSGVILCDSGGPSCVYSSDAMLVAKGSNSIDAAHIDILQQRELNDYSLDLCYSESSLNFEKEISIMNV